MEQESNRHGAVGTHEYLQESPGKRFPEIAENLVASQEASVSRSEEQGPGRSGDGIPAGDPQGVPRRTETALQTDHSPTEGVPPSEAAPRAPRDSGSASRGPDPRSPALLARCAPLPVGAESGSVGGSAGLARGGPGGGWSSERVWAAAGSAMETVQLRNPPRR